MLSSSHADNLSSSICSRAGAGSRAGRISKPHDDGLRRCTTVRIQVQKAKIEFGLGSPFLTVLLPELPPAAEQLALVRQNVLITFAREVARECTFGYARQELIPHQMKLQADTVRAIQINAEKWTVIEKFERDSLAAIWFDGDLTLFDPAHS